MPVGRGAGEGETRAGVRGRPPRVKADKYTGCGPAGNVANVSNSFTQYERRVPPLSRGRLLATHGLQPAGLLRPRDSPGRNPGAGCRFLLQRTFPAQGLNLPLLHRGEFLLAEPPGGPIRE